MKLTTCKLFVLFSPIVVIMPSAALSDPGYELGWYTIDCGGDTFSTGGEFSLGGTIGQADAGVMSGGNFELIGGFWSMTAAAGTGIPAAKVTGGFSRKSCDLALAGFAGAEPRTGGLTELHITFDMAPGGPGGDPVTIEEATCTAPTFAPYSGASAMASSVVGNDLVLLFTPGLENARTYRFHIGSDVTTVADQFVEVRVLLGDVNGSGRVNANDRSLVVSAWTSPANFSCDTDIDSSSRTNATDRGLVVSAWTGAGTNCAP